MAASARATETGVTRSSLVAARITGAEGINARRLDGRKRQVVDAQKAFGPIGRRSGQTYVTVEPRVIGLGQGVDAMALEPLLAGRHTTAP